MSDHDIYLFCNCLVASVHTTVLLEEPSDARIIMKDGNVLDATEQFIVHQCNCESTYAKGFPWKP